MAVLAVDIYATLRRSLLAYVPHTPRRNLLDWRKINTQSLP